MQLVRFKVTSVKDDGPFQLVSGRGKSGEVFEDIYRPQSDGLTTHPVPGSLGVAMFGGSREKGVVLSLESGAARAKNTSVGGKVLYGPDGQVLRLKDKDFEFETPLGKYSVNAKTGQINIGGTKITPLPNGDLALEPGAGCKLYLGGAPGAGSFAAVQTVSGPSVNVMARI